jgi:hypothetical protein
MLRSSDSGHQQSDEDDGKWGNIDLCGCCQISEMAPLSRARRIYPDNRLGCLSVNRDNTAALYETSGHGSEIWGLAV